jgi:hypothetical protein
MITVPVACVVDASVAVKLVVTEAPLQRGP